MNFLLFYLHICRTTSFNWCYIMLTTVTCGVWNFNIGRFTMSPNIYIAPNHSSFSPWPFAYIRQIYYVDFCHVPPSPYSHKCQSELYVSRFYDAIIKLWTVLNELESPLLPQTYNTCIKTVWKVKMFQRLAKLNAVRICHI